MIHHLSLADELEFTALPDDVQERYRAVIYAQYESEELDSRIEEATDDIKIEKDDKIEKLEEKIEKLEKALEDATDVIAELENEHATELEEAKRSAYEDGYRYGVIDGKTIVALENGPKPKKKK